MCELRARSTEMVNEKWKTKKKAIQRQRPRRLQRSTVRPWRRRCWILRTKSKKKSSRTFNFLLQLHPIFIRFWVCSECPAQTRNKWTLGIKWETTTYRLWWMVDGTRGMNATTSSKPSYSTRHQEKYKRNNITNYSVTINISSCSDSCPLVLHTICSMHYTRTLDEPISMPAQTAGQP